MSNFMAALSPRDRLILGWAIPVIVMLLCLLGARAVLTEKRENTAQLDLVLEDIAWLQAQRDAVARSRQGCTRVPWNSSVPDRLAARYQLGISPSKSGSDQLDLTINSGQGNRVISYLQALSCQGDRVEELTLETLDQQGAVKGRVVVRPPVT